MALRKSEVWYLQQTAAERLRVVVEFKAVPDSNTVEEQSREVVHPCSFDEEEHVSLCEALDRVLNKGAVVAGDIMISVADVDLLYLELRVVLTSIETALRAGLTSPGKSGNPDESGRCRGN